MKMELKAAFGGRDSDVKDPILQVAALCTRQRDGETEVLLITSSNGRWILPKGWPMDGKSNAQAAKIEAWEEAGVKAVSTGDKPIATLRTEKQFDDGRAEPCDLEVYRIVVDSVLDDYPEVHKRKRKWLRAADAAELVSDAEVARLLKRF